jgi:[acyl-carrier-protein] S-malonyltransferase
MATALLFAGQGAQFPRMGADHYAADPVFARAADEFLALMGGDLRERWLSGEPVDRGELAQPLLFAVGYAAGKSLIAQGFRPDVLLGHSVGECVAGVFAGVFDLAAAARIMTARLRAVKDLPAGGMLAVAAAPQEVPTVEGVVVGAYNAPRQTVLCGLEDDLRHAEGAVRAAGLACVRISSCEPWHSPVMRPACAPVTEAVAAEDLQPPRIPIRSGFTPGILSDETAVSPGFWGTQMAEPVRFWPALSALLAAGEHTLVEAGPCAGLTAPARRHPAARIAVPHRMRREHGRAGHPGRGDHRGHQRDRLGSGVAAR